MSDKEIPTQQPRRARVLIVENDPDKREEVQSMVELWGYEGIVAGGTGDQLLYEARRLARQKKCHLAITDLRVGDDSDTEDYGGLAVKADSPYLRVILYSAFADWGLLRADVKNSFDDFVHKAADPERLKEALENNLPKCCVYERGLPINYVAEARDRISALKMNEEGGNPEEEVEELLSRLFPKAKKLKVDILFESQYDSDNHKLSAPRPRSLILHVTEDNYQPVFVKVAREEKIRKEVNRYREHVERRLVGGFSPPLKLDYILWNVGGAVYPEMGGTEFRVFFEYFYTMPPEEVVSCLQHLFTRTWGKLYAAALDTETEEVGTPETEEFSLEKEEGKRKPILPAYNHVLGVRWWERLHKIELDTLDFPMAWQDKGLPNPLKWLQEKKQTEDMPDVKIAITHGDLHGDNMLVDDYGHIWVIDFERSGPGPIIQDFTELEADIITRLLRTRPENLYSMLAILIWALSSSEEIYDLSLDIGTVDAQTKKAMEVIYEMRVLVAAKADVKNPQPYFWGLLINILFRLSLLNPEKDKLQIFNFMTLAGIICYRLDHWQEHWPPQGWPKIWNEVKRD